MKKFLIFIVTSFILTNFSFSSDVLLNDCETLKENGTWIGNGAERKITDEEKNAITSGKFALKIKIINNNLIKDDIAILSDFKPEKFKDFKGISLDVYIPFNENANQEFYDMLLFADCLEAQKIYQKIANDALLTRGKNKVFFEFNFKQAKDKEDAINENDRIDRLNFVFVDKKQNNVQEIYFDNIKLISKTPTVTPTPTVMPEKKINDKRIIVYYPYWNPQYRSSKIPLQKVTHICHSFIAPITQGEINYPGGFLEPDLIDDAHRAGVKVLVSIGGADQTATAAFRRIAGSEELRKLFAENVEKFLREYKYDGIDFDWEFPEGLGDKKNFVLLLKEIKNKFLNSAGPAPDYLITMAVSPGDYYAQWLDYKEMDKYVNFYNVMTYDFHGSWSDHCGHNAPLYSGKDGFDNGSCASAIDYIVNTRGVKAEKVNLGIPFYGRKFLTCSQMYEKCSSGCSDEYLNYYDIHKLIGYGWVEKWDEDSFVPYLIQPGGKNIISYDNARSIRAKVDFAKNKNLGGVFVWEITGDFIDNENIFLNEIFNEIKK